MSFTTFAQNYEDVTLWRALGHIQGGFYIDVGACEPVADSVTKAFYDRGWSGINVEPMPDSFERLAEARPRDTNLMVALEDRPGQKDYFAVDGGNGRSTGNILARDRLLETGVEIQDVPTVVRTLADVCEEFVTGPIHFLKIDVEGNEEVVLRGNDWKRFRPWVVIGEIDPVDLKDAEQPTWGKILRRAGYTFARYDGLNAIYAAKEHPELLKALRTPPNFYDGFRTVREAAFDEIAVVVGLREGAAPPEVLERVRALYRDRIDFEHEANRLRESDEEQVTE